MDGYSTVPDLNLEEMREQLQHLNRDELRQLAFQALLISDGPYAPAHIKEQDPGKVQVTNVWHKGAYKQFVLTGQEVPPPWPLTRTD